MNVQQYDGDGVYQHSLVWPSDMPGIDDGKSSSN